MKNRTILTMILATTIISSLFVGGCGANEKTVKAESTAKAEKINLDAEKPTADIVTVNITVDKGWNADSTPAILHVTAEDESDFYHAIQPDAEGGKGSTEIMLEDGTYKVKFVSPLNNDGSAYEIYDMGATQEIKVDINAEKNMTVDCPMTQIPAEQVTDEMLSDIIKAAQEAVKKGDDTLKGTAVDNMLNNLVNNVAKNPNVTEETKAEAEKVAESAKNDAKKEELKAEGETSEKASDSKADEKKENVTENNTANNNAQSTGQASNNTAVTQPTENNQNVQDNQNNQATAQPSAPVQTVQPSTNNNNTANNNANNNTAVQQPAQPVHTHTWADHVATKQEWVVNIVMVPDYETQTTYVWVCNCGAEISGDDAIDNHGMSHILAGEPANGHDESRTTQVQVGSHEEDHGSYQTTTYVDYRYCTDCGARQ